MFPPNKTAYSSLDKDAIFVMSSAKDKGQGVIWQKEAGIYQPVLFVAYDDLATMGRHYLNACLDRNFTMQDNQPRTALLKYQMEKGGVMKDAGYREISVPLSVYTNACFKEWGRKPHATVLGYKKGVNKGFCDFSIHVSDKGTRMVWFDRFQNAHCLEQDGTV